MQALEMKTIRLGCHSHVCNCEVGVISLSAGLDKTSPASKFDPKILTALATAPIEQAGNQQSQGR